MRNTKAFTLVELIVVITILAILGTIAFISLQGYSVEARDSKRLSDVANIAKKVSLQIAGKDAKSVNNFTDGTNANGVSNVLTSGHITHKTASGTGSQDMTALTASGTYKVGKVNFTALQESAADFQDPKDDKNYVYGYVMSKAGNYFQVAATLEAENEARVVGNYVKNHASDVDGLIAASGATTKAVINEGSDLAY